MTPRHDASPASDPELAETMDAAVDYMAESSGMDVNLRANYEGQELFWHALLGTYTFNVDTPGAGDNQHIFSYDPAGTHDFIEGFSLYGDLGLAAADAAGNCPVIAGALPTQAVIEMNPRDYMRLAWTFAGAKQTWAAAPTATFPTRLPVLGRNASTPVISNSAVKFRSARITISLARDEDRFVYGQDYRAKALRVDKLRAQISAEVEIDTTASAGLDLWQDLQARGASAPHNLAISHSSDGTISGGTQPYSFAVSGAFGLRAVGNSVQDGGVVMASIEGELLSSTTLSVTITNGIGSQVTS
jgi:hypothetical protein